MKANQPTEAIMLLPGGHGNINLDSQGHIGWGDDDFVIRARSYFVDHGITAVIPDVPTDRKPPASLAGFRTSEQNADDLRALAAQMHGMAPKVWMVAYDTGATSALNAIARGKADLIAGLVLISPTLEYPDPDSTLLIDGVKRALERMPVLVIGHQFDPCSFPVLDRIRNAAAVAAGAAFSGDRPEGRPNAIHAPRSVRLSRGQLQRTACPCTRRPRSDSIRPNRRLAQR